VRKGSKHTKQLYIVKEGRWREINKIVMVFGIRRGSIVRRKSNG